MKIIPVEELIKEREYLVEILNDLKNKLKTAKGKERKDLLHAIDQTEDWIIYTDMDIASGGQRIYEDGDELPF